MTRKEIEHRIKLLTNEIGRLNHRLKDCYNARSKGKFNYKKGKAHKLSPAVNAEISRIRTKQNKLNDEKQELIQLLKTYNHTEEPSTFDILKQRAEAKLNIQSQDEFYNDGM